MLKIKLKTINNNIFIYNFFFFFLHLRDGTTDVTRTVHLKNPTDEEKEAYTRVLLGNLDVQRLIWPSKDNISGGDIDILARRHLWMVSINNYPLI